MERLPWIEGSVALQEYLSKKYSKFNEEYNGRSILIGPASKYTSLGALVSITLVRKNRSGKRGIRGTRRAWKRTL